MKGFIWILKTTVLLGQEPLKSQVTSGAAAVQVPRVPGHPLNFDNGCQAPVLKEASDANKPNFLKNFKIFLIVFAIQPSFFENRAEPWDFFELGTRPLKALEPPLII